MDVQLTCKGITHTEVLESHINKQFEKVVRFLQHERSPISIEVVLVGHPDHAHNEVHINIITPQYEVHAHREGLKLYSLIDEVIDIVYDMLHKEKRRHVDERKDGDGHHRP
jgi:ribosomal subunit interface protein